MPSWSDLQNELKPLNNDARFEYVSSSMKELAAKIADHTDRNLLFYASSFLQKPHLAGNLTSIGAEDLNGFMTGLHGHHFDKGLLLILHTPGGRADAAHTIVDYLRSKYSSIDALVPTYAMSAGTMIALGCDKIVMGSQSQLGPTDPQLIVGNRAYSAHSLVEQFNEARNQITEDPTLAHAWAPVLRSFGPALLREAVNAISYGESLVQEWLEKHMFAESEDRVELAQNVAAHFGGSQHGSHGRRIDRDEAKEHKVVVADLEDDNDLRELVLTLYHLVTIAFEMGTATKTVVSSNGNLWIKHYVSETGARSPGNP